ncbi:MAG TPA: cytochrome P450 [Candidatus Saccharimonadales bacterium]|nr:cytochrome P450 [Candidatus Saccharimonadales bacterium]
MQLKAKFNEKRAFLALRPSNYIAGRTFRHFGKAFYIPKLGYFINDPELTKTILRDTDHFSFNEAGGLGTLISELWGDIPTLLSMEGEEHDRVKFALLANFKEESLTQVVGQELKELTDKLCADLNKGQEVDVARYIRICTSKVTSKLLGVSDTNEKELLKISNLVTEAMGLVDLKYKTYSKANKLKGEKCVKELKVIAKKYYDNPKLSKNSLINQLKALGYSDEKTYGFITMFLIAGTVTVSSSFPRLVALLIDTGSFDLLVNKPELLESAIDEGLRYITPGPILLHGVKETASISGYKFKKGRRVIVLLYNILHDSRYTQNANIFDIEREQNPEVKGLWFGVGAHFCMGSVLAKLEIKTILKSLIKLDGTLEIKKRSFRKVGIYPGYESLVISLKPSR